MAKIYNEDLIRFLYNETSTGESNEISIAILSDNNLLDEYEEMKETISLLNTIDLMPSKTSISIIMEESLRQSVHLAHS